MNIHIETARNVCIGTLVAAIAIGCDDEASSAGTGTATLSIEAEDTIPDGLDPGTELENIVDGWTVRYDRVLVTVGNIVARSSEAASELSEEDVYLLDLKQIPSTGFELLHASDVDAVRYDEVSFENPVADESNERGPSVSPDDLAMMVDNAWSIYVSGMITKDGETKTFAWGAEAPTSYTHCGPEDGDLGFAVASGATTSATFTIHGDHWFFNGFPEGAEIVERRAQWIADADLDGDGETTMEELQDTMASDVFPSEDYSLASSPIPITTAYDFFVAQSQTIGHFQGEGECEWNPEQ